MLTYLIFPTVDFNLLVWCSGMGIDMIAMNCSLYCRIDVDEMKLWLRGNYNRWINKQNVLSLR